MRKPGLAMDGHVEFGARLSARGQELSTLVCELSRRYPINGTVVRAAERAAKALRSLRSALENAAVGEHGARPVEEAGPYYGDACNRRASVEWWPGSKRDPG
jgi:hypothetical protein